MGIDDWHPLIYFNFLQIHSPCILWRGDSARRQDWISNKKTCQWVLTGCNNIMQAKNYFAKAFTFLVSLLFRLAALFL